MEKKKIYLLTGVVVILIVVVIIILLVFGGEGSTMLSGVKKSTVTQNSTSGVVEERPDTSIESENDEGLQYYVRQQGDEGDIVTCETKFDCPDPMTQACWNNICKTAGLKTKKYQIFGGGWLSMLNFWHTDLGEWWNVFTEGRRVITFGVAIRAKRADVDVSEVDLPSSSIDFADAMYNYMVNGGDLITAIGLDPNDYELENNVLFKGGKTMGDQARTGEDLLAAGCLDIPGHASIDGVACIRQQPNNPWQWYFRGRTSAYFPGPDEGGQGGAYHAYIPKSSTKWWSDFAYFVVAVAPKHPEQ